MGEATSTSKPRQPRGEKQLQAGRHGIPRAEVMANQRARIIEATVSVMCTHGYYRTTVERIVNEADLSRRTFYDMFASRDDVVIAAQEALVNAVRGTGKDGFIEFLLGPSAPPELLEVIAEMLKVAMRKRSRAAA